jgi:hypothetical protein
MADLKHLGDEIRTLLRQLNGRQKATLLALGAVILVPLLWLSVRSTDESWLAIRNGAELDPAVLNEAEAALRESGVTNVRVDGQRLFVRSEKLPLANAALAAAGIAQPEESSSGEAAPSIFSPFRTAAAVERESQNQLHRNIERALATIAGIQKATVISSRSKPARWGQKPEVAAAVYVSPDSGSRLTPELRASICASVARMIPDLVPERIIVTDRSTGRSWTPDENGSTFVDSQELAERYEARIAAALTWLPDVEVSVSLPGNFKPAFAESTSQSRAVGYRSLPNQSGTVTAGDRHPQSVMVRILVPDATTETDRIVTTAERALPFGVLADVTVSRKTAVPAAGDLFAEEQHASSPVLPALALTVIFLSAVFAWRLRTPSPAALEATLAVPVELLNSELPLDHTEIPAEALSPPGPDEPLVKTEDDSPPRSVRPQPRFTFLQQAGPRELYRLLAGEHPQTLALVLRHLSTKLATDVVSLLPSGIQSEVIRRIAEADLTGADVVEELEETLRLRTATASAAEAPATVPAPPNENFLSPMERFEEIVKLTPPNLKRVVEEVEESLWANALHEASETLRFRVIASLPPQQARSVRARLSQSTPPKTEIETTRNRIVETVNALRLPNDAPPLRHEFVA